MAYALNGSNGVSIVHPPVNDSKREMADMTNWPYIRLLRAGHSMAPTPQRELLPADDGGSMPAVVGWSEPCPMAGRSSHGCRVDFSNVCWFFGRDVYSVLQVVYRRTGAV